MEITEKIAYLKGLMEGLGIEPASKEGKMFTALVDILDDIALSVNDLEDGLNLVSEQVEILEEDMDDLFEDEDDDDDYEDDDYDGELYEVTCPTCGDTICIDEDMLDEGEIACPGCGESLEFDIDDVIDECGCGGHCNPEE